MKIPGETLTPVIRFPITVRAAFVSLGVAVLAPLSVVHLADWTQLEMVLPGLDLQLWLVAVFVVAYLTGFMLNTYEWRVLTNHSVGTCQRLESMHKGFQINRQTPVKMDEIVCPLLASRYGKPASGAPATATIACHLDFAARLLITSLVNQQFNTRRHTPSPTSTWLAAPQGRFR